MLYSDTQSQVHTQTRVWKNILGLGFSAEWNQKGLSTHETSGLAEPATTNPNRKTVKFYLENFHPPK